MCVCKSTILDRKMTLANIFSPPCKVGVESGGKWGPPLVLPHPPHHLHGVGGAWRWWRRGLVGVIQGGGKTGRKPPMAPTGVELQEHLASGCLSTFWSNQKR